MVIGDILKAMKQGANPQQIVLQMLQDRMGQTPMGQNLLSLIQNHDEKGIEDIARNICKSQNRDFDTEFANFKQQLGIK